MVDAAQGVEAQTRRQRAPRDRQQPRDRAGASTRSTCRPPTPTAPRRRSATCSATSPTHVLRISAKTGIGVGAVLDAVCERIPPPDGDPAAPPRALIMDSVYDQYRGVIAFVRVVDGALPARAGDPLHGHRRALRGRGDRRLRAGHGADRRARGGRGRLRHHRRQGRRRRSASATPSPTTTGRPPSRCRATRTSSRWSSRASSRPTARTTATCATRWPS